MTTDEKQAPDTVTLNSQWQGSAAKTQTPLSRRAMQPKWLDLNRRAVNFMVNLLSPCEKLQTTPQ